MKVEGFPDWDIDVREVSMGVYQVLATDKYGRSIDKSGTDPEALMEEVKEEISKMVRES